MAVERIFYVTATELSVLHCASGAVLPLARFELNDEGVAAFSDYIMADADHASAVLVDVIEEEFRIENVPHVMGSDRHRLLDRKAAALFRGLDFRSAQVIGREPGGRRDDQVLFSAINKPEVLERWLKALRLAKVPLTGVYSVSMLGASLINKQRLKHDNTLLLTIQNGRLLRQSFFSNGKLKLSRLTPLTATDAAGFVSGVVNEVDRMKRYLGRLQLLNFKQPMEVYLLSGGEQLQHLQQGCRNEPQLNYHFLDLNQIAAGVGLKQPPAAEACEKYFAHLLSRKLPDANYVQPGEQRYYLQYRMRRWVVAASILLVSASLLWSVADIHAGQDLASKAERIAAETAQMQSEYEMALANMPAVDYPPRVMRATVEANQQLAGHKPKSLAVLAMIGASLAAYPNIELDQLRWGLFQEAGAVDENGVALVADGITESVTIKAHLKAFPANYQAAFKQVEALMTTLKQNPAIATVAAVGLPLNTDPASLLVGETRHNDETPQASFELAIKLQGAAHEI